MKRLNIVFLIAACGSLPATAQTLSSTLTSVTCAGGVTGFLAAAGTINIYDGPTFQTSIVVSGSNLNFSWPIPTGLQDGYYHVISVNVQGIGTDLVGSPQSFTCTGTPPTFGYPLSYTFSALPSSTYWTTNGSPVLYGGNTVGSTFSSIYKTAIPVSGEGKPGLNESNTNEYEINSTLNLNGQSGGSFFHYIWATQNAQQTSVTTPTGTGTGTYYAVELHNPTFDNDGNCSATLQLWNNSAGAGAPMVVSGVTVPCASTMQMRTVTFGLPASGITKIWTMIENQIYSFTPPTILTGQPGIGAISTTGGGFTQVQMGPRSLVPPAPLRTPGNSSNPTSVATSVFPSQINIHYPQPVDTTGPGVIGYSYTRTTNPSSSDSNTGQSTLGGDYTDSVAVQPSTNYIYAQQMRGFHGIFSSQTNIFVTTPASGAVDPRRTGVRTTGSYWGAMGEQIDTLSGNLNLSLPLLQAQGRNGTKIPFRLSYNSQNWREDGQTNPTATWVWNLGEDVGYGYGWKVQLGSLTPYWYSFQHIDHYLFIDSTGAEYHLTNQSANVWSSSGSLSAESIYVWYDANTNLLHFRDGSTWLMGCISGGLEPDLGTMYPTEVTDSNGNQVVVRYATGYGTSFPDSSGRISEVEDVRAIYNSSTNTRRTYYFTYLQETGDPIPLHIASINNTIGINESYMFGLNASTGATTPVTLKDPFAAASYGNLWDLTGITMNYSGLSYSFHYDGATGSPVSGAGQLTQAQFPFGGTLGWSYTSTAYSSTRNQMEATGRTMNPGSGSSSYTFTRTGSSPVHNQTTLSDPHGDSKVWTYCTTATAGPSSIGLVNTIQSNTVGEGIPASTMITWSADPNSNAYASTVQSCVYSACANAVVPSGKIDGYGNITQKNVYDYGVSTGGTATRTYAYTYAAGTYLNNYLFSLPLTATVTNSSGTVTAFTNNYDQSTPSAFTLVSGSYPNEWVTAYNSATGSLQWRGNLTSRVAQGVTTTMTYNMAGTMLTSSNGTATGNATVSNTTNFSAPDLLNLNGNSNLQTNLAYSSFLGLASSTDNGNSATSLYTYDSAARIQTATSADGSVTTYSYPSSSPYTTTAKVTTSDHGQNRYTETIFDGFGRPKSVIKVDGNGVTQSEVDTTYSATSAAPLGMATVVTLPYTGSTVPNVTSTFDGAGNILIKAMPDGSTTTYSNSGNSVTTTDPAGKSKMVTRDVFGNVTSVVEPNPNSGTYTTGYAYDWVNHLVSVDMGTRDTKTQTPCSGHSRTFTYSTATLQLTGSCEPETGTTSFAYNADGTLHTKTLANTNIITYKIIHLTKCSKEVYVWAKDAKGASH